MNRWMGPFLAAVFLWAAAGTAGAGDRKTHATPKQAVEEGDASLEDLGFSQEETKSDPRFQGQLEARTDMLRIHQTLGLITAVPMTTEFVLGLVTAGNVANGSTDTGLHTALGISTAGLYITTAMFAILAPKPEGMKASGNTELHQILAWIHGPLMILTPLVGDMANDRIANHQPAGDLATLHGIMAGALVASYLTSLAVITF